MGLIIYRPLKLDNPVLIAAWPGIGQVGILAVDSLRRQLQAEKIGELESWEFFFPMRVEIKGNVLAGMQFPECHFYYHRSAHQDLLFFIGQSQPADGKEAYEMASQVLEVARQLQCRRVYATAVGVAPIHHETEPRVQVVASSQAVAEEFFSLTGIISRTEANTEGMVFGLNGLLLGLAQKRGFEAVCLLGEVPDYLAGLPLPFPRSARAVFRAFLETFHLGEIAFPLEETIAQLDSITAVIYDQLPLEIKAKIEERRLPCSPVSHPITQEDGGWLKGHIGELFKKASREQ